MVAGTLARYYAKQAVRTQLRREKIKIAEIAPRDLRARTETYLDEHLPELLEQAQRTIAASPVLQKMVARRRCPQLSTNGQRGSGCATRPSGVHNLSPQRTTTC